MAFIVTTPDGSRRDLLTNPWGAGHCSGCIHQLNYNCNIQQNQQLCTKKEQGIFEACETRLTFHKLGTPVKEATVPAKRPEQPFINLVNMLEGLAQANPTEYCKVVRSGIFNELLRNSELQLKELNLLKSDKQ
jgi:hypothetical protein